MGGTYDIRAESPSSESQIWNMDYLPIPRGYHTKARAAAARRRGNTLRSDGIMPLEQFPPIVVICFVAVTAISPRTTHYNRVGRTLDVFCQLRR